MGPDTDTTPVRERLIESRRRRQTGTTVDVVYGLDGNPGWWNVCVEHGGICEHETRALAMSFASVPIEWCPTCQENAGIGANPTGADDRVVA